MTGIKPTLCILTNIVAPYRVPIFEGLARRFDTHVLYSGEEDNRVSWCEVEPALQGFAIRRSSGVTLRFKQGVLDRVYDYTYVHLTPGYVVDLLRIRPDAVVSTEMGFRTIVALAYGSVLRKPVWIWWGGTRWTERNRGLLRRVVRLVISRWTPRWISYGRSSTRYLASLGIPRERILEIQNCVDERRFTRPAEPALQLSPKPVLLYAGQLIRRKGVEQLLDAAARLQRGGYRFSLLLVGSGPEQAALEVLSTKLGLTDVYFCPAQPPDAMPGIYRSADCLVFPSLEDVWGLVVNEALWSGVPVLSSIYAGCAEELLPAGNLFDPLDTNDFVRVLRQAVEGRLSPADCSTMRPCEEVASLIAGNIAQVLTL